MDVERKQSFGIGGAGNLRRPSETAEARQILAAMNDDVERSMSKADSNGTESYNRRGSWIASFKEKMMAMRRGSTSTSTGSP